MKSIKKIKDTLFTPVSILLLKTAFPLAEKVGLANQCTIKIKNIYENRYEKLVRKIEISKNKKIDAMQYKSNKRSIKELSTVARKKLSLCIWAIPEDVADKTDKIIKECVKNADFYKLAIICDIVCGDNVYDIKNKLSKIVQDSSVVRN